ncbi:MAG: hypothetical protein HFACDABA_00413 [Anaerolineales bacterium]|nr:hypothetical protein [Anaerolineales bacterium]
MTLPFLLVSLLLALLLGALYHLIRGGDWSHLLAYLAAGIIGFAAGHFLAQWRGWLLFPFGPFNLGAEISGSLAFLILSDWLLHLPPRTAQDLFDRRDDDR